MAEFRWKDKEGQQGVFSDRFGRRLVITGEPSMRRDDGAVMVGIDLPDLLLSEKALEAAAKAIDAYIPMTAGAHSVCAAAFVDALWAAIGAVMSEDDDGS